MKPKLIAIVGPTASGKTSLGIEIAKMIDGEVISVDSRMVYRGMDIGTAKPDRFPPPSLRRGLGGGRGVVVQVVPRNNIESLFELTEPYVVENVSHWGIDLIDPDEDYSVAQFKTYAEKKIQEILHRNHVPILVGGTGLWLSAVIDNLDLSSTPSDETLRNELETRSLSDLFAEYKRLDPIGAETIDRENKRRVVRALEVTRLTGKPFSQLQTRGESKYDVLQIGLSVEREILNDRINHRVDEMIARELVTEVRGLRTKYGCTVESMTGIGYRQICAFLDRSPSPARGRVGEGGCTLADAIEEIKKDTRHFAKRQMTWFKRDPRIIWIENSSEAIELTKQFFGK